MASLYKQYIRLLKKWPVDNTKKLDLLEHVREQVKVVFHKGEKTKVEDVEKCERYIKSLNRIVDNHYMKKYPVNFKRTSSGLTLEQCTALLSTESQNYLKEQNLSRFDKLKKKISNTFARYSKS